MYPGFPDPPTPLSLSAVMSQHPKVSPGRLLMLLQELQRCYSEKSFSCVKREREGGKRKGGSGVDV